MTDKLKKVVLTIVALAALALGGAALAGATSGGNSSGGNGKAVQEQGEHNETGKDNENGDRDETGDHQDQGDKTLSGNTASRAREAAVAATGGGKAGSVEAETEKGATYGVEVVKPDGSQVDVFLDEQFNKIAIDSDEE